MDYIDDRIDQPEDDNQSDEYCPVCGYSQCTCGNG